LLTLSKDNKAKWMALPLTLLTRNCTALEFMEKARTLLYREPEEAIEAADRR